MSNTELSLSNNSAKLKVNPKTLGKAVLRTAFDYTKGSLGQGTLPEWFSSFSFSTDTETQAFRLIATAIANSCQDQLRERLSQSDLEAKEGLVVELKL